MADQGAEGLLSPFLRKRRFAVVRPYLNGRVLDVGCSSGGPAEYISPGSYFGFDVDLLSIELARARFPSHRFEADMSKVDGKFDTIVSLAVIEHVNDPFRFLANLVCHLVESENAHIVITTPHPVGHWVHKYGVVVGLFSKHASEEHGELLDRELLSKTAYRAGLELKLYKRFLFGFNQFAILSRLIYGKSSARL